MRAFLLRLTGSRAAADDLAQETFMRALSKMDTLQDSAKAKAWMFTTAYRIFIDDYRKCARRKSLTPKPPSDAHIYRRHDGLNLDLSAALDTLGDDARACIWLSLGQGMSHGEVADVTDIPLGTVKSHIARGRARLQTQLADYYDRETL